MPDAGKYGLIEVPITTTNAINATGTGVFVEFWVATSNLVAGNGWALQLSPDGANWNTRLSETTGRNHAYALYHYDLDASERVSTRKMRFHFAGNGPANPASDINLDDIKVASISNAAPSPLTTAQTYHPLIIPDVITGTTFNLAVNEKTKQFRTGTATNTNAYNNMLFGGPTLIMN